jgi:RHS repeat-associated protein
VSEWDYDNEGQVLSMTDALNNVTKYEYDAAGNQVAVIDAKGRRTESVYDDKGQLVETIYPDETPDNPDDNLLTIEVYDKGGQKRASIDESGRVTHYRYDAVGQLVETFYPDGMDTLEQFVAAVAPGETPETVDWSEVVYPDAMLSFVGDNPSTKTEYYESGQVLAQIDELGNRVEFRYDESGRLVETIYPDDTPLDLSDNPRSRVEYDNAGRRVKDIDANGRTTEFVYDAVGLLTETRFADGTSSSTIFDAVGQSIAEIDRAGRVTKYEYNGVGWLTKIIVPDSTPEIDEDNPTVLLEYDEAGRLVATTDELGNRTESEYDREGRETLVRDALGNETTYTYDALGNLLTETNALNQTTKYVYGERNNLLETHFADGTYIKNTYDELSRIIATTDQNQNTTQFEHDARGRLSAVVNARGSRTEYGYDVAGNLVSIKDANNRVTTYEYDERNRRIATILPMLQRSTVTYDAVGNILSVTDFNQNTIQYIYDDNNRQTLKKFSDDTSIGYTYTATGQIETVTDQRGITTYKYDERDRLVARQDATGPYLQTGETIEYGYDAAGNRISVNTPSKLVQYTYDRLNRLETVTNEDGGVTTYLYDPASNLVRTELPNSVVEVREYDKLNRLLLLKNVKVDPNTGAETVISSYEYTLDAVGNRTEVLEKDGRKVKYDYDELHRLTREEVSNVNDADNGDRIQTYTYDNVGNRLTRNDSVAGKTTYVYDDNDRLKSITLNDTNVTIYEYDDNGNTTSVKNGNEKTVYVWDEDNRLVEVQKADGQAIFYTYDPNGIRLDATIDGVTTRYLVDTNRDYAQVLEEYVNDELANSYIYGRDLISQNRDDERLFYLVDGLGSIRLLTNEEGFVAQTYVYDAFGNLQKSTGDVDNNYLFAGEQFDEELDEYYLRQRYYDPNTGRFTRRDTYEGDRNNPVSLHKYLYANANPVTYIDPTGLFSTTEVYAATSIANILNNINYGFSQKAFGIIVNGDDPTINSDTIVGEITEAAFGLIATVTIGHLVNKTITKVFKEGGVQLAEKIYDAADVFVELNQLRKTAGIPTSGQAGWKRYTRAKLEVELEDGKTYAFYGKNAHNRELSLNVNAISRDHAEADVFQQAKEAGLGSGDKKIKRARLIVDRELCSNCGQKGQVNMMALDLKLDELDIITPNGGRTLVTYASGQKPKILKAGKHGLAWPKPKRRQ